MKIGYWRNDGMEQAYDFFKKFVSTYAEDNYKIKLKYEHTLRVAKLAKEIALSLNLSNEDLFVVELASLLHDIGRFEQIKKYDSFNDLKTLDHAAFGVKLLFDHNVIRQFIADSTYDDLLKRIVYVHNKYEIPTIYSEKERLLSEIVRDADKVDIFYLETLSQPEIENNSQINPIILNDLLTEKSIRHELIQTKMEEKLAVVAMLYDINFKYSLYLIAKNNYLNQIIDQLMTMGGNLNVELTQMIEMIRNKINAKLEQYK